VIKPGDVLVELEHSAVVEANPLKETVAVQVGMVRHACYSRLEGHHVTVEPDEFGHGTSVPPPHGCDHPCELPGSPSLVKWNSRPVNARSEARLLLGKALIAVWLSVQFVHTSFRMADLDLTEPSAIDLQPLYSPASSLR
jgi:hypothetical protein